MRKIYAILLAGLGLIEGVPGAQEPLPKAEVRLFDVVIVGGTPGGVMAAIAAAREGAEVALLNRMEHIGGLPANGLGASDIVTRGATGGLFLEFVRRNKNYYVKHYGADSPQVRDCSDGYHFEPSVAEKTFEAMLAEQSRVQVFRKRQFDAAPAKVYLANGAIRLIEVLNLATGLPELFQGRVFIDATYEGDLSAAAGVPCRLGRESQWDLNEPMAGQLYKVWGGEIGPGTTGMGDNAIQAYNYRLALTKTPTNRVAIVQPPVYFRDEYLSLVDDLKSNRVTGPIGVPRQELEFAGVGRIVNLAKLPNGKYDANNQHAVFLSTDLPEENWAWPTASWIWRDQYAQRLRNYTLGLLWFCQQDPALPEDFKARCREWGLAKDEYVDNAHFPRQVYVREGRRMEGEYLFTARDALPVKPNGRPPVHRNSITASHYPLDSHAVRKREPGRVHLDGFFSLGSQPYTVPYGVMVPKKVANLLMPVPVSGTHVGFSTLRMEPCWMALGEAAGVAASLALRNRCPVKNINLQKLQDVLVRQKGVLIFFRDVTVDHPSFAAVQHFGLTGLLPDWEAKLDEPVSPAQAAAWLRAEGHGKTFEYFPGKTTRGEFLMKLYRIVRTN